MEFNEVFLLGYLFTYVNIEIYIKPIIYNSLLKNLEVLMIVQYDEIPFVLQIYMIFNLLRTTRIVFAENGVQIGLVSFTFINLRRINFHFYMSYL
jgi:hypothetical protein